MLGEGSHHTGEDERGLLQGLQSSPGNLEEPRDLRQRMFFDNAMKHESGPKALVDEGRVALFHSGVRRAVFGGLLEGLPGQKAGADADQLADALFAFRDDGGRSGPPFKEQPPLWLGQVVDGSQLVDGMNVVVEHELALGAAQLLVQNDAFWWSQVAGHGGTAQFGGLESLFRLVPHHQMGCVQPFQGLLRRHGHATGAKLG